MMHWGNAHDTPFRHQQVTLGGSSIHVVEAGDAHAPPFLFLHGWPESWRAWQPVMALASRQVRAIAIDLPGIGESTGDATDGSKRQLADKVHELISKMGLRDVTLVGQDIGAMIVYAYVRGHEDIRRAVIMDVVVPGVEPWEAVIHNPHIWHFALHAVASLPERLVAGRQADYFRFFYDTLSCDASKITPKARAAYAEAYASEAALHAGFNWYRAFTEDAKDNQRTSGRELTTPLLYVRGDHESGKIADYVDGLTAAGARSLEHVVIPSAGHFTQEEAPDATWRAIGRFAGLDA
jgi:pimeloyl-ACP methyl ester carboxylesterase